MEEGSEGRRVIVTIDAPVSKAHHKLVEVLESILGPYDTVDLAVLAR
eukprot:CAMPEP_0183326620 /NCGR_PEP_ID=MMETSP0160_2-20130417/82700_1 /TAXON_ID=2839 ORGANISM="Odontella Sinensis, Strain Grunow 1884" /NCGR_SAMPLE_ID=MMETSP0160_2 /ASSEMBLY_ACC=CAM_ASM_000250 /LENGTH=46 /DNA_ID= /DNA_START= /DNA_END= /DNA_ORIENTATION=